MNAHVFVDAENVSPDVTFRVVEFFGTEHTITKVDIVAKEDALSYKYRNLDPNLFRVQNCYYGKNSADTWLCVEIVRAIVDEPALELVIIVSSDKDFLPAIKFAADFGKKIFIVSNGIVHKNLTAHMKTLGIDRDAVELKDFRCGFDELSQRLAPFLSQMNYETQRFFYRHGDEVRLIFVRRVNGKLCEVPFVEGMSVDIFRRELREMHVIAPKRSIYAFCTQNFLKVVDERVHFLSEEEILPPVTQIESVDKFLKRNADNVRKIFVKHADKLYELPFADGMPLEMFGRLLRERKIIGKTFAPSKVAEKSLLVVRDGKLFLPTEDELKKLCNALDDNVDEFFLEHAADIRKIFVKHGQKVFELPFVDGMSLEVFGRLLRNQKVIAATGNPAKIAEKSLLTVRRGKVFLPTEDELARNFVDQTGLDEKFFEEIGDDIQMIFVKSANKVVEIPFADGMSLDTFTELLRRKNLAGRPSTVKRLADENSFAICDGKVFRTNEPPVVREKVYVNVDDYLNEHALRIRTLEIRNDGQKFSIPFVDGMPLNVFALLLHERKIISSLTLPASVLKQSSLVVRNEKVFRKEV